MNDRYLKLKDAVNVVRNTVAEGTLESTLELRLLDKSLTADVRENVKGKWIYTPIENGMIVAMCSICKKCSAITPSVKEWYRFCPNCGADMRGEA